MMKLKSSLDLDEEEDADDDDNLFAITDRDQDNLFEAFQEISNEDIIQTLRDPRHAFEIVTGPLADKGKPTLNKLIRVAAFTFISKVGVLDRIEEMGMQDIDVVRVAQEISELITSTHHDPIDQESQKKIREVNFKLPDEKLKEGEICRMQDPDLVENEKDEKAKAEVAFSLEVKIKKVGKESYDVVVLSTGQEETQKSYTVL